MEPEDIELGSVRRGWQHEASSHVDKYFKEHVLFDRLPPRDGPRCALKPDRASLSVLTALPHLCP